MIDYLERTIEYNLGWRANSEREGMRGVKGDKLSFAFFQEELLRSNFVLIFEGFTGLTRALALWTTSTTAVFFFVGCLFLGVFPDPHVEMTFFRLSRCKSNFLDIHHSCHKTNQFIPPSWFAVLGYTKYVQSHGIRSGLEMTIGIPSKLTCDRPTWFRYQGCHLMIYVAKFCKSISSGHRCFWIDGSTLAEKLKITDKIHRMHLASLHTLSPGIQLIDRSLISENVPENITQDDFTQLLLRRHVAHTNRRIHPARMNGYGLVANVCLEFPGSPQWCMGFQVVQYEWETKVKFWGLFQSRDSGGHHLQ